MKLTRQQAVAVAEACADAYSCDRYTPGGWRGIAVGMAQRGYNAREIEAVLRSKHTRWAGDEASKDGRVTSTDFFRYADNERNRLWADVPMLVAETFND